jgi:hypothetical protein
MALPTEGRTDAKPICGCEEGRATGIEEVGRNVVDAAIKVHRALGPGLLESAYQKCLTYELSKRGLRAECEVIVPIV